MDYGGKGNMERLTIEYCGEYMPKGLCSIDRQGGADDCELCYENCKAMREGNDDCSGCVVDKCFDKLGKYEDLEEQGKLQKLPCAVGDTVYVIPSKANYKLNILNGHRENNRVYEQVVNRIEIFGNGYLLSTCDGMQSVVDKFYKETWFLTKEEAETALKEL